MLFKTARDLIQLGTRDEDIQPRDRGQGTRDKGRGTRRYSLGTRDEGQGTREQPASVILSEAKELP
jgi:hypothetical protein